MLTLGLTPLRLGWFFFILVSFWPWERDANEVKKSSLELTPSQELLKLMRVALFYEKSQVLVSVPGAYEVKKIPGNEVLEQGAFLSPTTVRVAGSGIQVGTKIYPALGLRISSPTKEVQVGDQGYRQAVRLLKNPKGNLTIVNEVGLEDYLRGVLPKEMNPTWPSEALKAQAVVSRTYAVFKNIENRDFPFTLGSDVGDQVYGGKSAENPETSQAVLRTQGEILTYRGKIFPAFFHSTCGGRTTRADFQWRVEAHPSLRGVECGFCRSSKYYVWQVEVPKAELQNLLARKGYRLSGLTDVSTEEVDLSGRPRFFKVQSLEGSRKIPANEFRLAVGPDRMKSTAVRIERQGEHFRFRGRGWGHGAGMCQFGAKHLAELGYRYRDILRYYYPESEIRNLDEFLTRSRIVSGTEATEEEESSSLVGGWFRKLKSYLDDL